jgi:hypothetical protein
VQAAESWKFDGFSAPCSASPCTPPLGASITATFSKAPIGANLVFVSSQKAPLNGGVAALDQHCQTLATNASLPGVYKAFVETSTQTFAQRFAGARGWVRMDGLPFLDQITDLLSNDPPRAVMFDETGAVAGRQYVQTGFAGNTCTDWTANAQTLGGYSDLAGRVAYTSSFGTCPERVYCFGTDRNVAVAIKPPPFPYGRYVFTSSRVGSDIGVAGADAHCQAEAAQAGLPGLYRAALATTTQSAGDHVGSLAGTWRRPDGVVVTFDGLDQFPLLSGLHAAADGTSLQLPDADAFGFGASSWTALGTRTCSDWTSTSGDIEVLLVHSTLFVTSPHGCIQTNLLCVQST